MYTRCRCWAPTYQLPEEFRQVELPRPILTLSGSSELLTPYDRCVIRTWLTGTYADCNLVSLSLSLSLSRVLFPN